ncbi:hypothetical protein ACFY0G_16520 [Streptomyces sp. NPDC001552]|uniref:hypothetical protein n=1 Tax=Streptomyces sp. NPDC001552 TaxID=3364587 RepID=UPI0036835D1D
MTTGPRARRPGAAITGGRPTRLSAAAMDSWYAPATGTPGRSPGPTSAGNGTSAAGMPPDPQRRPTTVAVREPAAERRPMSRGA